MSNITRILRNGNNIKPINTAVIATRLDQILNGTGPLRFLGLQTLFLANCRLELVKTR
jgi:hypothetical protein